MPPEVKMLMDAVFSASLDNGLIVFYGLYFKVEPHQKHADLSLHIFDRCNNS